MNCEDPDSQGLGESTLPDPDDRCRILVVDDEESVRVLLELMLTHKGHHVHVVSNAEEAMREVSRGEYRVVLTDIRMPQMDGMDFSAWIRREHPGIDVIIMTAFASIETAAEAVRLGAFDYLLKPFPDIALVASTVERAIEKQQNEIELKQTIKDLESNYQTADSTNPEFGSLISGFAHKIRNPLAAITTTLELVASRCRETTGLEQHFTILHEELDSITELVRSVSEYATPAKASQKVGTVGDMVAQAVDICSVMGADAQVSFCNEVREDLPAIRLDEVLLVRAFQRIVENAIQHTPANGTITITAEKAADSISVAVRDGGPGFQTGDLKKVFDPFFSRRPDGAGLGLAIARRIVVDHRGAIHADNHPDGGGLITVTLPIA